MSEVRPDDDAQFVVERVTAGRRGPLAVALLAVVVVGVLLWKPWDRATNAVPSPSSVAVVPTLTPTPSPPSSSPPPATPGATAAPRPTKPPTPAPTTTMVDIEVGVVFPGEAFVTCSYRQGADGSVLARVLVNPPSVQLWPDFAERGVRRVAWHAELQVNELETVFSASWKPVAKSPRQFASRLSEGPLALRQIDLGYDQSPPGPTSVVRVVVVVDWYGAHRGLLGSRSVVATTYGIGGTTTQILPEGCLAYS